MKTVIRMNLPDELSRSRAVGRLQDLERKLENVEAHQRAQELTDLSGQLKDRDQVIEDLCNTSGDLRRQLIEAQGKAEEAE